jgi:hypothetical protein
MVLSSTRGRSRCSKREEAFGLICATTVGFMEVLEIWGVVESVTYVLSIDPIVGAPDPNFWTWGLSPHKLVWIGVYLLTRCICLNPSRKANRNEDHVRIF